MEPTIGAYPHTAEVIGFDLGHGDTSVARVDARHQTETTIFEVVADRRYTVTAVGRERGEIVIGRDAVESAEVEELQTGFKSPDVDDPVIRAALQDFVAGVAKRLRDGFGVQFGPQTLVVFGHPAGWSPEDVGRYRAVLAEAVPDAESMIIPESRAAFLTMRDSRRIPADQLRADIMIVDLGSSTTDFTIVHDLQAEDAGSFDGVSLGASKIEEFLFQRAVERSPDRHRLERYFGDQSSERARALLAFREAKERYFARERQYQRPDGFVRVDLELFGLEHEGVTPQFVFTSTDVKEAVSTRLEALGESWRQRFRHDLERAAARLREAPRFVVLTGGAARMSFVAEIAKEVFPDSEVAGAPEPEHAISRGLAAAGSLRVRTQRFEADIERLIRSGRIERMIEARIEPLAAAIGSAVAKGSMERFIVPEFLAWRESGAGTLRDITARISDRMDRWQRSPEGGATIVAALSGWYAEVEQELQHMTQDVCSAHKLPLDALRLPRSALRGGTVAGPTDPEAVLFRFPKQIASVLLAVVGWAAGIALFGSGTALLAPTGPLAPVGAALVVWLLGQGAKEWVADQALDRQLPKRLRQMWSARRMEQKLLDRAVDTERQIADEVVASIAGGGEQAHAARAEIVRRVGDGIAHALRERAEQAATLIR